MSLESIETFENIARTYKSAGFPNHRAWYFEPNEGEDIVLFRELKAYGLIEPFGLGEQRWRLTQPGLEKALTID